MISCIAIDDDPIFLKLIETYFTTFTKAELVASYENPAKGIVAVARMKPDVLLIDREMPYLDGFETLDTLDDGPKVIMISAHSKLPDMPLDIEIAKYIDKTKLSPTVLEEAIVEAVS